MKTYRQCKAPFSEYKSPGPVFYAKEGRWKIYLLRIKGGKSLCITYARYLYCCQKGYIITGTVDHIDGDRTNDTFSNLQELSHSENARKSSPLQHAGDAKSMLMKCLHCGTWFRREKRRTHLGPGRKGNATFCSKSCGYYSAKYLGMTQEYKEIPQKELLPPANTIEPWEMWSIQ